MHKVSVVIPSYNHEKYLGFAVDSVLAQVGVEVELIIIDDGSSDNSVSLLRQYSDPRIKLTVGKNSGAHNAINLGLSQATGDFIAILNSDDAYHIDRLRICVDELQSQQADMCCTWLELIDSDGRTLGVKEGWKNMLPWPRPATEAAGAADSENFIENLLFSNFVSTTSNMVFRRSVYDAIGGMQNLRFAHDWDYMLRAASRVSCILIPKPLVQYRLHQTNTIKTNRAWMLFEICWIYATGWQRLAHRLRAQLECGNQIWVRAFNSINTQGNDRLLSLIQLYIATTEKLSDEEASTRMLEDAELRQSFISLVDVGVDVSAVNQEDLDIGTCRNFRGGLRKLKDHFKKW